MEGSPNQYTAPMKLHGADLADYAVEQIDIGLEEAQHITRFDIETSIGHAVMHGIMTAEEGLEALEAYDRAFHS